MNPNRGRRGSIFAEFFDELGDSIQNLRGSLEDFDLRMETLHNMLARLVPLIFVFIGAIPAVITAIVGLAAAAVAATAALLAIGGLGALGVGLVDGQFDSQRLKDVLSDIRDNFIDAFAPLAERLQPVFEGALDGLERLFDAIAREGDALMALTDEAKAFGGFVLDFVPDALRTLGALVEALAPAFGGIARFVNQNFNSIVRTLVELTQQVLPIVAQMVLRIGEAIPALINLSIGFARVADGIILILGGFGKLLGMLGIGNEAIGTFIGTLLTGLTVVALLNTALFTSIKALTIWAGQAVVKAVGALTSYNVAAIIAEASTWSLVSALVALVGILSLGIGLAAIGGVVATLSDQFGFLASNINKSTDALSRFDSVAGRTADGPNVYSIEERALNDGEGGGGGSTGDSSGSGGSAGSTTVIIEGTGDKERDKSNAKSASFRMGRTTYKG